MRKSNISANKLNTFKYSSQKMDNIMLLRIIACAMVYIVHFGQRMGFEGALRVITNFGEKGVYLFFVISGYLSFYSKTSDYKRYIVKRAIKLLPVYYLSVFYFFITETFLFNNVPVDETNLYWLRYLFFLAGLVDSPHYFWSNLGITWTIFVFVSYYLFVPLLKEKINSYSKSVIFILITYCIRELIIRSETIFLRSFSSFIHFSIGILCYFAIKNNKKIQTILLLCIVCFVYFIFGQYKTTTFYSIVFGITLLRTYSFRINSSSAKKILLILDENSYALYLCHGIIFCGLIDKFSLSIQYKALIAIFGTLLLTLTIHYKYEKPIQDYLTSKYLT